MKRRQELVGKVVVVVVVIIVVFVVVVLVFVRYKIRQTNTKTHSHTDRQTHLTGTKNAKEEQITFLWFPTNLFTIIHSLNLK